MEKAFWGRENFDITLGWSSGLQPYWLLSLLTWHPTMCRSFHPLWKPVWRRCGVKVEVQRPAIHEGVVKNRLHVALEPLDGHAVQVAGQPLLVMMAVWVKRVQLPVAVAAANVAHRHVAGVRRVSPWQQLQARFHAGHVRRGPWETSQASQGNHGGVIQVLWG